MTKEIITLREVIRLITNEHKTTKDIAKMFEEDGKSKTKSVNNRLRAAGASDEKEEWDFTGVKEEYLDEPFWSLMDIIPKEPKEKLILTQEEIAILKEWIAAGLPPESSEQEKDNAQLIAALYKDQAHFKQNSRSSKNLNIPIYSDELAKRLDHFADTISGLEKKFIVNKAIETFLDMYEGVFGVNKQQEDINEQKGKPN